MIFGCYLNRFNNDIMHLTSNVSQYRRIETHFLNYRTHLILVNLKSQKLVVR